MRPVTVRVVKTCSVSIEGSDPAGSHRPSAGTRQRAS